MIATPITFDGLDVTGARPVVEQLLVGAPGDVVASGPATFAVATKSRPVWTYIVAVLFFPLGLFALLVREEERTSVTLVDQGGRTDVVVSGAATAAVAAHLSARRDAAPPPQPSAGASSQSAPPAPTPAPVASPPPLPSAPAPPTWPSPGTSNGAPVDGTVVRGAAPTPPPLVPATPTAVAARLVLPDGNAHALEDGVLVLLGREPRAGDGERAVAIADAGASRTHAAVRLRRDAIEVTDLRSTNGVLLDGTRMVPGETVTAPLPTTLTIGDTPVHVHAT